MGHALRRRRGDRVALAREPREDDVGHFARGGPVRPDGVGAEDGDHVLTAEKYGGVPVLCYRRRPDVQVDGPVRLSWTNHHRGRESGQGDREPHLPGMEVLSPA